MEKLPFIPQHIYNRRSDIHGVYGGNWQSGICPSKTHPYIFIFTGKSGNQHGYKDGWDNPDVFTYTGEGQKGNMQFVKGNLALRDHLNNGKRVFLFENEGGGLAKFISEVECFDIDWFDTNDTLGNSRSGIKFFFKRKGIHIPIQTSIFDTSLVADNPDYDNTHQPSITERSGLVTTRVGHGAYRKRIIYRWEGKCAVTGFEKEQVLIASHILPWAKADNDQRLDVNNGILLSPTYDALFDRHLISFENSGKILLTEHIDPASFEKIHVTGKETILNLRNGNFDYLEMHRNRFNTITSGNFS